MSAPHGRHRRFDGPSHVSTLHGPPPLYYDGMLVVAGEARSSSLDSIGTVIMMEASVEEQVVTGRYCTYEYRHAGCLELGSQSTRAKKD